MISGGNATVYVSDLDRAVKFYTDTLGLSLKSNSPGWAELRAGESLTIGLHPTHPGGPQPGKSGSISIGFELDEPMDQAVRRLEQQGIAVRSQQGFVRLAFFTDPDGNELYFSELSR